MPMALIDSTMSASSLRRRENLPIPGPMECACVRAGIAIFSAIGRVSSGTNTLPETPKVRPCNC